MRRVFTALLFLPLLVSGIFALDGREIMEKARDAVKVDASHALVRMLLIEKNGSTSERILEMFGKKGSDGLTRSLIVFHRPASVKDTRFLVLEQKGRPDDKFIYLPALRRVRRIAAEEGGQSFMGSDFTYDDMSSRDIDDDVHTLLREENLDGVTCYVVKSVPTDAKNSQYHHRVSWVRKDNFIPIRVEMYEDEKTILKVLAIEKLEKIEGIWTPMVTVMKNVKTGHATRLEIQKIKYNEELPDALFSQKFLETGRL